MHLINLLQTVRLCLLLGACLLATTASAQGPLTPPGPPAPTGRTLDQLEPRLSIPAGTSTITIAQPGSYYLSGNLTVSTGNGILVTADNVTLDLNGFTISSTSASPNGSGIFLRAGSVHVSISNGHIRGTTTVNGNTFSGGGFANGILAANSLCQDLRVTNVAVSGVGTSGIDLSTDNSTVITGSTVRTAGSLGLRAGTVSDSAALLVGGANAIVGGSVANSIGTLTNPAGGTAVLSTQPTAASRTVIPGGSSPYTITQPGSYVLGGNLTVASGDVITINSDNVTLDLNGFSLLTTSSTGSGNAISLGDSRSVIIRNGHIRGSGTVSGNVYSGGGFVSGISGGSPFVRNVSVTDVIVSGCSGQGIALATFISNVVERCVVSSIGGDGIAASVVTACAASNCIGAGISAETVANSRGESTSGNGISATLVSNSFGVSQNGYGISGTNVANSFAITNFGVAAIRAFGTVSYSRGSRPNGVSIESGLAIGCTVTSNCTVTASIGKFLGTP